MIRGILVKKILSLAQQTTLYDLSLALGLKHFFCFTKNDEQYFSQEGKKINLKWVKNYFTTKNFVHGTLIIAADKDYHKIQKALGQIRLWLIKTLQLVAKQNYAFVWIVNWPLFEYDFENES